MVTGWVVWMYISLDVYLQWGIQRASEFITMSGWKQHKHLSALLCFIMRISSTSVSIWVYFYIPGCKCSQLLSASEFVNIFSGANTANMCQHVRWLLYSWFKYNWYQSASEFLPGHLFIIIYGANTIGISQHLSLWLFMLQTRSKSVSIWAYYFMHGHRSKYNPHLFVA